MIADIQKKLSIFGLIKKSPAIIKRYEPYGRNKIYAAEIYGTTIHELAHSVHQDYFWSDYNEIISMSYVRNALRIKENGDFDQIELRRVRLLESYASGVEWALTNLEYTDYVPGYDNTYTAIVQNLIDEKGSPSWDQVEGFTITEIEHSLRGTRTWIDWKEKLKTKRSSQQDKNAIEELFNKQWDKPKLY